MTTKKGLEFLKLIGDYVAQLKSFDQVLKHVKITGGAEGHCLAEFKVIPENLNRSGGLHGGFTATVVDNYTTYALMSKGFPGGVSVDLNVSYLRGAKEGDEIIVDAKAVRAGRNLAYLECELRNKIDGKIIAKGSQTKYIGGGK